MIRINLLPTKQAMQRQRGRTQLLLFAGIILIQVVFLGLLYVIKSNELSEVQGRVSANTSQVKKAEGEVKDANTLNAKAEKLQKQIDVLKKLEQSRSGPVMVLDELQAMVSPPRNEEDRFAQLQKNWNVDWDTRRLWIESFEEKKGSFVLKGGAVSADDAAEFFQRMTTAKHFRNSRPKFVRATNSKKALRLVEFEISGDLTYTGELAPPEPAKTNRRRR
jgi:Tfp pilus assembly protein PilN